MCRMVNLKLKRLPSALPTPKVSLDSRSSARLVLTCSLFTFTDAQAFKAAFEKAQKGEVLEPVEDKKEAPKEDSKEAPKEESKEASKEAPKEEPKKEEETKKE